MNRMATCPPRAAGIVFCLLGLLLSATAAGAQATSVDDHNIAVRGYDPVSYISEHQARKGSADLTVTHEGATYRFSSEANRAAFVAEPDRFLPAYGGYCAYGVAQDHKVPIDPEAFTVVDGRLYLNYSKDVMGRWRKDIPGNIVKADKNWEHLRLQPSD